MAHDPGHHVGTFIGTYRVLEKLGEGGMGAIWRAQHTLLGREAAIKVLLPALSVRPELVQRFFNEARAAAAIGDPGIVQIFDFGIHDGAAYIVMELLAGESLESRVYRCERLSTLDAVTLGRQIAVSLAAAHAKNIVHRDLKPENVFVVPDLAVSGGERTKVLDFGIAKLGTLKSEPRITQTGEWFGTPVYASPEQCRSVADVDHRSDIYSLGCMLFFMVTGEPPFESSVTNEVVAAHLRDCPRHARSLVPDVPESLDVIITRSLEKDPDRRYQSMTDIVEALDSVDVPVDAGTTERFTVQAHLTTLTSATGHRMPTTKRVQRGHTIVALCALAVALFGVTTFITSELASDERAIAKQPSVRSPTQMSPLVESAACPSETTEPVSSASATATTTAVAPSSSTVDTRANVVPVPAKRKAMRRANERKKEGTIRVDDTSKKRHLGYVDRDD